MLYMCSTNCNIYLTQCFSDQSTINLYLSAMANPSAPSEEQLVANLKFMKLSCVGTEDELLKRCNTPMEGMAEVLGHHCREELKRTWPIQMYQPMEHLRYQAEQISRLESLRGIPTGASEDRQSSTGKPGIHLGKIVLAGKYPPTAACPAI
ncbi:hypothetical protein RvY_01354 [Ramazzottius varieornatus]|uniref:Uncharacterized protein n=1 Tax=Ramazzottius varieornatus TaxID=947166 RepID=A0A1D1UG19_RAMVA|nr:hypothetical protein RvY_01354 [Ramazzottius varieornatus]